MLDAHIRPLIDPTLNRMGRFLHAKGLSANVLTGLGFVCGLGAMGAIYGHAYGLAALLLMLNRLFDGLDGAVARVSALTDFGGFFDIVCDFIIYGGVVFAFGLAHPETLPWAAFLMFSFKGPMVSFLAYAILAAKRERTTSHQGVKSFYYLSGICEGTETFAFLLAFCIFPEWFVPLAAVFGTLCWLTMVGRVYAAWRDFGAASNAS